MLILLMTISAHSGRLECTSLSDIQNLTEKQNIYKFLKFTKNCKMLFLRTREDYTAEELFKIKQLRQLVESMTNPCIRKSFSE